VCGTDTFTVDQNWVSEESFSEQLANVGLSETLVAQEREMIASALAKSGGQVAGPQGAAARLGMPPSTLESKIKSLKISKQRFRTA